MNSSSISNSVLFLGPADIDDVEKASYTRNRFAKCYTCVVSSSFCKCLSLCGIAAKYGLARFLPCFKKQDDEDDNKHFTDNDEDNYPVNNKQAQTYQRPRKYMPPAPVLPTPPPSLR